MPDPRVVLDTNTVLMPVIRTGSSHRWMMDAWSSKRIIPIISQETQDEFLRKLRAPGFEIPEERIATVASQYLDYCERISIPEPPPPTPKCRDATDQKFIVLAQCGKAQYLVTNDPDLLVMREQLDQAALAIEFAIIRPAELFAIIEHQGLGTTLG